ncbi:MAG: GNAT family N-acetyltransferase [archaeon]|jgi:amino-acid N-acetyltransferase
MTIRQAVSKDVPAVRELIDIGAKEGVILNRTNDEINELITKECMLVAEEENKVIGLICLDFYSKRLSEIRTVYVSEDYRGKGIGKELIHSIIDKANKLEIHELMTITTKDKKDWFFKNGFAEETKSFKIALFKKFD